MSQIESSGSAASEDERANIPGEVEMSYWTELNILCFVWVRILSHSGNTKLVVGFVSEQITSVISKNGFIVFKNSVYVTFGSFK